MKEEIISLIPRDEVGKKHCERKLNTVCKELLWYTPIDRLPVGINTFYDAMINASKRGVKFRTIAENNNATKEIMEFIQNYKKENPNFEIRFVKPNLSVIFTIWDKGEGMNFFTENPIGTVSGSKILTTNNTQLIKTIKDYFELKWNSAMKEVPKN